MKKSTLPLLACILAVAIFTACHKAPGGVIPEDTMAHVLADFAQAEALMEQRPDMFSNDSSKMALKQSILKKYDADLAMYDSSLVWYAHNLKLYAEVHDNAIKILEKEADIKSSSSGNKWLTDKDNGRAAPIGQQQIGTNREFSNEGDSANIWTEPQQWILTSAMKRGYITFDYKPDKEHKRGDAYTLNFKLMNDNSTINILLAIDYSDGTMSYINRTAHVKGWSNFSIQADSTRVVKRIYGFINYNIKPMGVAFIDSIYMLRTHLDPTKYGMFGIQKFVAPKAILEKMQQEKQQAQASDSSQQGPNRNLPAPQGLPGQGPRPLPGRGEPSSFKPKPGLNKSSLPGRDRTNNPNGAHLPKPPVR